MDLASVIHALGSNGSTGLDQIEAARRLNQHGANELKTKWFARRGSLGELS